MKTPVRSFLITAVLTLATVSGFLPGSTVIAQVGTPSVSPAAEPTKPVQEPLTIQRFPSYYHSQQPLTPEPEIILRFSGPVSEKAVKEAASFTDSKSERSIPVKVSRPNAEAIKEIQPWGDDGNRLALSADHFVMVKPITELSTSVSWVLRLEAPLASIDGKRTLAATWRENLGTLYPFTVRSTNGVNRYDEANFIQINLSKVVHDEITEEILAGFLKIQPEPKNFGIKKSYQTIQLSGDFENGRTYEVTVFPGLKAYDETQLVAQVKSKVVFTPNPGFVTLPAFSKVQNASGAKRFDILTGNLKGLRVRVKQ
ncbi:MAG: hypothetical protein KDN20_25795, partial [Verrucomicrobiae bacterium]|nr:hypothetical protein [Verrucomicrobiae bacterium]